LAAVGVLALRAAVRGDWLFHTVAGAAGAELTVGPVYKQGDQLRQIFTYYQFF
jgi:hypothetical protein